MNEKGIAIDLAVTMSLMSFGGFYIQDGTVGGNNLHVCLLIGTMRPYEPVARSAESVECVVWVSRTSVMQGVSDE